MRTILHILLRYADETLLGRTERFDGETTRALMGIRFQNRDPLRNWGVLDPPPRDDRQGILDLVKGGERVPERLCDAAS
jgi:hypothetical protein